MVVILARMRFKYQGFVVVMGGPWGGDVVVSGYPCYVFWGIQNDFL